MWILRLFAQILFSYWFMICYLISTILPFFQDPYTSVGENVMCSSLVTLSPYLCLVSHWQAWKQWSIRTHVLYVPSRGQWLTKDEYDSNGNCNNYFLTDSFLNCQILIIWLAVSFNISWTVFIPESSSSFFFFRMWIFHA